MRKQLEFRCDLAGVTTAYVDDDAYIDTDSNKYLQINSGTCVFSVNQGAYAGVVIEIDYTSRHTRDTKDGEFSHQLTLTNPRATPVLLTPAEKESVKNGTVMLV